MEQGRGSFLLGWRTWTLWFIPVLATLYFAWVILVALKTVRSTVRTESWVIGGMILFAVLFVVEILLLLRRKSAEPQAAPDAAAASDETVVPYQPPTRAERIEAEWTSTEEQWKGKKVLELSLPPKSRNRGAVYAKSYVDVGPETVLRIEDLVADRADVAEIPA